MDKGDYVLVFGFLGFLGFLAFLAYQSSKTVPALATYVQVPSSLVPTPSSLGR